MGWLDQGVGHSFKNDPWGGPHGVFFAKKGGGPHIFYTEIQVNKK